MPEIENETSLELANANKVVEEHRKSDYEQGVRNADSMLESVGIESLLDMGGVIIDS